MSPNEQLLLAVHARYGSGSLATLACRILHDRAAAELRTLARIEPAFS